MRRRLIPAALSVAAVSAIALTAPSAGYAAPAAHGRVAKTVTVKRNDPVGDLVVKTGPLSDLATNSNSPDGFKPGRGTVVPATAADSAADLTKVTYRVRRTGPHPALLITYAVAGPFAYSDAKSHSATTYSETMSEDVIETVLGKGYAVGAANDRARDYGLTNKRGKAVACPGLRNSMRSGARIATQTVPLACLGKAGVHTARLRSMAMHVVIDASATMTAPTPPVLERSGTPGVTENVTFAFDVAKPSRRLPLTPLGK